MRVFVLAAGPPGSGKTTLAVPLAAELGLPLIAKDAIKEVLMETLGSPATVEQSRVLGRAAVETMLAVAQTSPGAVLESNFLLYAAPLCERCPVRSSKFTVVARGNSLYRATENGQPIATPVTSTPYAKSRNSGTRSY